MKKRILKQVCFLGLISVLIFNEISFHPNLLTAYAAISLSEDFDSTEAGYGSSPRIIGNWTFSVLKEDESNDEGACIDVASYPTYDTPLTTSTTDNVLSVVGFWGEGKTLQIQSSRGAFKLKSLKMDGFDHNLKITGYFDGDAVTGALKENVEVPFYTETLVTFDSEAWQYIDEFRIERQDGVADIPLLLLDEIVASAAVDITAPTEPMDKTISFSDVTETGAILYWNKATDDISEQETLQYLVYQSEDNNLGTVDDIETNGVAMGDYAVDLDTMTIRDLMAGRTYYFNVIVKDEAGNKTCYNTQAITTSVAMDTTPPTVPLDKTISFSDVTETGVIFHWNKATDDISEQETLQYLVYQSEDNNLGTVDDIEANGVAIGDYAVDLDTMTIRDLMAGRTYYFNVIVKDEAGNKTCYNTQAITTSVAMDTTPPTVPLDKTISCSEVTETGATLHWNKATDNISGQEALQYLVYQSEDNNLETVDEIETNGVAIGNYAADIDTITIWDLMAGKTYYFNVIVKDKAGNKTCYATQVVNTITAADKGISSAAIIGVTVPQRGATPVSTLADTNEYTAAILWQPSDATFVGGTSYTAQITIIPKEGYTLNGVAKNFFTVAGAVASNAEDSGVITAVFPKTSTASKTGGGSSSETDNTASTTLTEIKEEAQSAGILVETTTANEQTLTIMTIEDAQLEAMLKDKGTGARITIPITTDSDIAKGVVSGESMKRLGDQLATLEVYTPKAAYALPASEIHMETVARQFDENVNLSDIQVEIQISRLSEPMAKKMEETTAHRECTLVSEPIEFSLNCTYDGKSVEISKFNSYVERTIAIPEGIEPWRITTGVVVEEDGTVRQVPTRIMETNGRCYAVINSFTNSTYIIVYHPTAFTDMENHWAKDAVNDMGARMIVSGVESGYFQPDKNVTRAEFAAMVVRALGLKGEVEENSFSDVETDKWYCPYVETAVQYGLIAGVSAHNFAPESPITREQAMVVIAKAMEITHLDTTVTENETKVLLSGCADGEAVAGYAKEGISACLRNGIVSGGDGNTIAPQNFITRGEAAVIINNLLKKAELI